MGCRANVFIKESGEETKGVFLYTHWGGEELVEDVQRALSKRWRWDDYSYLARIIFCEMIKGEEDQETGFGISCLVGDGGHRIIRIDCDAGTVTVGKENPSRDGFIQSGPSFTFEQFVDLKEPNWETILKH